MPVSPQRLSLPVLVGMFLLMLLAVWLRADTFPDTYFADELMPLAVVSHMRESGTLDSRWDHADWRGDYAGNFYNLRQYNFSSYHIALLHLRQLADVAGLSQIPDLVLYRGISVLFQLGSLLLVFAMAGQLAGERAGLLAAASLVVMPQAVVDAHYARPESFVMLLVALACWLALQVHGEGRRRLLLPEAVVWGIAFACKFSFFPMAALALLAHWWRWRSVQLLLLWCAGFVGGIALSAPYILIDMPGFVHGVQLLLNQYAPLAADAGLLPSLHQLLPYLAVFFGPMLLLLPLPLLATQRVVRCFAVLALAVSLAYLLLFARQGVFFERNLSHLLPLWAVLFAVSLSGLSQQLPAANRMLSGFLPVMLLVWPFWLAWQINATYFRGLQGVIEYTAGYERELASRFQGSEVRSPSLFFGLQVLDGIAQGDILRVPQHKLAGLQQVSEILLQKGFVPVDKLVLPLAFLPYNQLQINHFPPAYTYYRRISPAGVPHS